MKTFVANLIAVVSACALFIFIKNKWGIEDCAIIMGVLLIHHIANIGD